MASFFTRALDTLTPWNRKGEVQRRQQAKKKKDDEEQNRVRSSAPRVQNAPVNQLVTPKLQTQRPDNLFAGLNNNLRLPGQPNTAPPVSQNIDLTPLVKPQPGTVIKPTPPTPAPVAQPKPGWTPKPEGSHAVVAGTPGTFVNHGFVPDNRPKKPGFFGHIGNGLKTAGQTAVGTVANVPELGLAVGRTATGLLQGAAHLPSLTTHALTYVPRKIAGNDSSVNRALSSANRAVDTATERVIDRPFGVVNRGLDRAAQSYADHVPVAAGGLDVYKREQVPLNILAALLTLGGSAAAEGGNAARLGEAGNANRVVRFLNKPLSSNPENVVSRGGRAVGNKAAPVVQTLNTPLRSARSGFNRLVNSRTVPSPEGDLVDAGEVGNVLTHTQLDDLVQPPTQIPVTQTGGGNVPIPVGIPRPGRVIREVGGDAPNVTRVPTAEDVAATRFRNQPSGRPDSRIEGVTPRSPETPYQLPEDVAKRGQNEAIDQYAAFLRNIGEGNGVNIAADGRRVSNNVRFGETGGKRMTKAAWREEAERQLRSGKAEPGIQKAFDDAANPEIQALLSRGERPDLPEGRPVTVKQVQGIPVRDETVVPTGLPETPGTVRATTSAAPMAAKSEAVANAPVVARPAQIPAEAQATLDNPKQFTKRQVAAARNQARLARQKAKADEATAAAMDRIESAKPPTVPQSENLAPTGKYAVGKKGNVYEQASNEAEASLGHKEMANRSAEDLAAEITARGKVADGDYRKITEAKNNLIKADPDGARTSEVYQLLDRAEKAGRSRAAQIMALIPRVIRKSATAQTLTNRWDNKIGRALDNPSAIKEADYAEINKANDAFTAARDRAAQLEEQYKHSSSEADFRAWKQAHQDAQKADEAAKLTELEVGKRVLKGSKGANAEKVISDLEKEADLNMMDYATASQLSGPATGFRNLVGTELAGVENRLFANTRAKISNRLFGGNVGGYDRRSARAGRKEGAQKFRSDVSRRSDYAGFNPLKQSRNVATTVNSVGESSLHSQIESRLGAYYRTQLKGQGLSGKQLDQKTEFMRLTDPDNMRLDFQDAAMKSSGLRGIYHKSQKVEQQMADGLGSWLSNGLGGVIPEKVAQGAARGIMRIALGYPTATGNFVAQSTKRLMLGLPSLIETGAHVARGNKQAAAAAFDNFMKEAGSGSAMLGLGYVLGQQGMVSGSYPTDPEERAKWEREGISENSIKINGAWHPIPQGLGMFGLPILTGAAIGREGDSNDSVKNMYSPKNLAKLLPTDQLQGSLQILSGNGTDNQVKNFVASGIRTGLPVGSLFNQVAKGLDPTKNDTTTKDFWHIVLDQLITGIPGENKFANVPDKVDDGGNVIKNPNFLQVMTGATSAEQGAGEQRSAQLADKVNGQLETMRGYGVLDDPNLKSVLDDKEKLTYDKLKSGKELNPDELSKLQKALVKGVSATGDDTAYLEREQYDTNLAALKLKRQLMTDDKTVKPSDVKKIDIAIKRGEIYKNHKLPYDDISAYESTSLTEWRDMGDPESDNYDPEMYQKLWDIDNLMTNAGVSYKKGALDKNKFYNKEKKAGSKSIPHGASGGMSAEFGTLKSGTGAPSVQNYETIDQKSGSVPMIRRVRPNIVHKIGSSG